MKKKTIVFIAVALAVIAALAAVLIVLNATKKEPEAAPPPTLLDPSELKEGDPGEQIDKGTLLLVFPRCDRASITTIEIHNESGDYTLKKNADESFTVGEFEGLILDDQKTAATVVASGYVVARSRVVDRATPEEMAEYGLDEPSAWWTLTDKKGAKYRVNVGDRMVSGDGYYCAFEGRDAVYVVDNTLANTVLAPKEYYVVAAMTAGVTQENYFSIEDFAVFHGEEPFVAIVPCEDGEKLNPDAIVEAKLAYPAGYRANDSYYITVLGSFVSMAGEETAKIAESEDDYAEYGLDDPPYTVHFALDGQDYDFYFSGVREDGYVYGISNLFNYRLIARFSPDTLSWLRDDLFAWVNDYPMQVNITTVSEIRIRTAERDVTFRLKHGTDEKGNATLEASSDAVSFTNENIYNFRQFYKTAIGSKLKGTSSLTKEERESLAADGSRAIVRLTTKLLDGRTTEYGFYRATTREALFTINGRGEFYINSDWPEKLASDLERLIAGLDIDSYGKD